MDLSGYPRLLFQVPRKADRRGPREKSRITGRGRKVFGSSEDVPARRTLVDIKQVCEDSGALRQWTKLLGIYLLTAVVRGVWVHLLHLRVGHILVRREEEDHLPLLVFDRDDV